MFKVHYAIQLCQNILKIFQLHAMKTMPYLVCMQSVSVFWGFCKMHLISKYPLSKLYTFSFDFFLFHFSDVDRHELHTLAYD